MPADIFSIGVDLGGTWIRLEAVDAQARRVRSLKAPAPALTHLPGFLKRRLQAWKTRPPHLIVASRGVWTRSERADLKKSLRALADHVTVMSDVEAAWYAAFRPEATGVIVIAGTGSIAFGRTPDGRSQRAGGWGPLLGDEGSAFWIGKTWLKQTQKDHAVQPILKLVRHSHQAVRRVAALTPGILNRARKGNPVAQSVVRDAQQHLATLAANTAQRLRLKKTIPLSWGGSLLNNPFFRTGVLTALRHPSGGSQQRFQVVPPGPDPALAIARLFKTLGR